MKKLFFLAFFVPLFTQAQDKLLAEGASPALYLIHKVAPKENYYSIGRVYNISPKEIAPFNNLQMEKGLSLGQTLKIPLNNSNFFQSGTAAPDESFVPVYYKIKEKEGLYRVAKNHNDLPLETLKQWNGISGDVVKNGAELVVGYLKVKTELSALAKKGIGTSITAAAVTAVEEKKPAEPVISEKPPVLSDDKKAVKQKNRKDAEKKTEVKEIPPAVITAPEKKAPEPEVIKPSRDKNVAESDFKKLYQSQLAETEPAEATGTAGIFKSTSGWGDKKYYCLHNSASPGTIIKITNTANGNIVYAKVLDLIPDIKMNEGVLLVISNAAADALGVTEGNFSCSISYAR